MRNCASIHPLHLELETALRLVLKELVSIRAAHLCHAQIMVRGGRILERSEGYRPYVGVRKRNWSETMQNSGKAAVIRLGIAMWLRGKDLNLRPLGYEAVQT